MEKLSPLLLVDLQRFRKYECNKMRDLLRVIRNKSHHYRDLPMPLQLQMGDFPAGYILYFMQIFPRLLVYTFDFMKFLCTDCLDWFFDHCLFQIRFMGNRKDHSINDGCYKNSKTNQDHHIVTQRAQK